MVISSKSLLKAAKQCVHLREVVVGRVVPGTAVAHSKLAPALEKATGAKWAVETTKRVYPGTVVLIRRL